MNQLYRTSLAVVFILFGNASGLFAQVQPKSGHITDAATGKAVEYAYVFNYSLHKQIYSNIQGEFRLDMQPGDTLVIYALGYYYKKIIVQENMLTAQTLAFSLEQEPYVLSEAQIIGITSYNDLRQRIINFDKPKTEIDQLNSYFADLSQSVAREAYDQAKAAQHADGVTFASVPILTPEERERIKLAKIIEEEHLRDQIYQKFNPLIVKKITGMTDDDDIIAFMVYCKFSDRYLLEVNDYNLASRIALKYELFMKKKQDEKLMKDPLNVLDVIWESLA
jgi:hypothetical protein